MWKAGAARWKMTPAVPRAEAAVARAVETGAGLGMASGAVIRAGVSFSTIHTPYYGYEFFIN
jgi:hypothetical protein